MSYRNREKGGCGNCGATSKSNTRIVCERRAARSSHGKKRDTAAEVSGTGRGRRISAQKGCLRFWTGHADRRAWGGGIPARIEDARIHLGARGGASDLGVPRSRYR